MPRLNYGTLIENIVVLEATRLCLDQIGGEDRFAFASAFAMPPLTQCWCGPAKEPNNPLFTHQFLLELSKQSHPPQTLKQMWSLCMRNTPHLPVQNYLKDEPNRYTTGGPNGALLAAMLAAQRRRAIRLWVNDDAGRYGAGLVETHVQAGLLAGVQAIGTTSDVGGAFPHTIPVLRDWLCAGLDRADSIRIGFLDPDNYAEGLSQVTAKDHQCWLRVLADDCGRVLSVMFSGCQNRGQDNAARDRRLASFHADAAEFYPGSLVFEYGNFQTGVKIRWPDDAIDLALANILRTGRGGMARLESVDGSTYCPSERDPSTVGRGTHCEFETCPHWVPALDPGQRFAWITLKTMPAYGFDHSVNQAARVRNVSRLGSQF